MVASLMALLLCAAVLAGCSKDENQITPDEPKADIEEYTSPVEDVLAVTSNLPAYILPYDYSGFGAALNSRLQNKVVSLEGDAAIDIASVMLHNSHLMSVDDNIDIIMFQLLVGKNIIIIEPTLEGFTNFCDIISAFYVEMQDDEEWQAILDEAEPILGSRHTLEMFHDMSQDTSKIKSMFLLDTDSSGIFAEAIALRGCSFHIVDRMKGVADTEVSYEEILNEAGEVAPSEAPQIDIPEGSAPADAITPYAYGLFADAFTIWIDEQEDYIESLEAIRDRSINDLRTRGESTTKYSLEDISIVQEVDYTISARTPHNVSSPLPVTVSFDICSIYMEHNNSDYYCVYKNIISPNQNLDCGPSTKRGWRTKSDFGRIMTVPTSYGADKVFMPYSYYGPYMRDLKSRSICHVDAAQMGTPSSSIVELPDSEQIQGLKGVVVEKYSPKNSIGSTDHTSGFSYGFDGGLYLSADPAINMGFSVSYDSSTTQTIDDLEIIASTTDGITSWDYVGHNLPKAHFAFLVDYSHSYAPSIMRQQCEVDQSWIWRVPNPTDAYCLYDETSVTTSIMYYTDGFFQAKTHYANLETSKRVSFLMMPPPRCKQYWAMDVKPYSDKLNAMLSETHNRFWNKDNHELTLADSDDNSRVAIEEFVSGFERDLNDKHQTWINRGFKGKYTFTFYKVGGGGSYVINHEVKR